MNLFVVHVDPVIAAQSLCDQHVVKMPTETAQMLSTICRLHGVNIGYKPTHERHPCTKWVGKSKGNFEWALAHGLALCREFEFRYGHRHAAQDVIERVSQHSGTIDFEEALQTRFVQAMPDIYRGGDSIVAYRRFYLEDKVRFARWRKARKAPDWWVHSLGEGHDRNGERIISAY